MMRSERKKGDGRCRAFHEVDRVTNSWNCGRAVRWTARFARMKRDQEEDEVVKQ